MLFFWGRSFYRRFRRGSEQAYSHRYSSHRVEAALLPPLPTDLQQHFSHFYPMGYSSHTTAVTCLVKSEQPCFHLYLPSQNSHTPAVTQRVRAGRLPLCFKNVLEWLGEPFLILITSPLAFCALYFSCLKKKFVFLQNVFSIIGGNQILQELVINWKSDELPPLEEDLIYFDAISCKRLFPINSSSFQGNSLITVGEIQLHFTSIVHKFLMLAFEFCFMSSWTES